MDLFLSGIDERFIGKTSQIWGKLYKAMLTPEISPPSSSLSVTSALVIKSYKPYHTMTSNTEPSSTETVSSTETSGTMTDCDDPYPDINFFYRLFPQMFADPLLDKLKDAHRSSKANGNLDSRWKTIREGEEDFKLDPTVTLVFFNRYNSTMKSCQETVRKQAVELQIFVPDLEEREALFDATAKYLGLLVKHYDELSAYFQENKVIDKTEEAFHVVVRGNASDRLFRRLLKDFKKHINCKVMIDLREAWLNELDPVKSQKKKKEGTTQAGRAFQMLGETIFPPQRPTPPKVLLKNGVPVWLIDKMETYSKSQIQEMYDLYKNRIPGAKYPYEFKKVAAPSKYLRNYN